MQRFMTWAAMVIPALCLIGCGGGTTGAGSSFGTSQSPMLEGVVLDVDGESSQSVGVPLVVVETGEQVVTGPDGTFSFENLPEGDVTLALDQNNAGVQLSAPGIGSRLDEEREDEGERDDAADDSERRDGSILIRRVRRGDTLFIQIRIEGGRIIEIRITRPDEDDRPGDGAGAREIEIAMVPTDANTDPDMEGEIELSIESNGDQEFEVEVEDADVGKLLEAVVIDRDDNEASLGVRAVELDGDAEWKLDTGDGDELPFGVAHLARLEGHRVVVRDIDGVDLLRARLPELPPRHDDMRRCFRLRGRARLTPLVEDVHGWVEIRASGCVVNDEVVMLRQVFLIAARGLTPGQEVEFFMEDPDDEGTLVALGTLLANADGGATIVFDTGEGDDLPFGVGTVRELRGLAVQVRDDVTGEILLASRVADPLED